MQQTWVQFLGGEDLLDKETATHSSILAWTIPLTEEPGRLQSTGSQTDMAGQLSTACKPKCTNKTTKLLEQNIEENFCKLHR